MPRLNPYGRICAGVGGTAVSLDRQIIAQPAGAAQWLDGHRVIYHRQVDAAADRWQIEALDSRSGDVAVIDPGGANHLVAGGGKWCAFLSASGMRGMLTDPQAYPYAIGPDGTLAFKPSYHAPGGLALYRNGAARHLSDAKVANVQVLDFNRVTWTENNRPRTIGLPVPVTLPVTQWLRVLVLRDGRMLALYQDGNDRLVLQWADRLVGLALTGARAWTFRPDLVELPNGKIRVVWATNEGESPDSIVDRDVDLAELTQPLEAVTTDPVTPPSPPTPEPEPSMDISKYLTNRIDVVEGVKLDFPNLKGGAIVDQTAHRLNREHGLTGSAIVFGRKARRADGGDPNDDVLAIRRSMTDVSQKALIDILIDGGGRDEPTWSVVPEHEEHGNGFWRPPVAADLDGVVPQPNPPSQQTHKYMGGGNDTGECDECGRSRFDPVHAIPGSKGPHGYDPGEDGAGLCDVCQQEEGAAIHQGVTPPVPPVPPVPVPPSDATQLDRLESKIDRLLSVFRV